MRATSATRVDTSTPATIPGRFAALGRWSQRRPWVVLGVWAAVAVAGVALAGSLFGRLSTVADVSPTAESALGEQHIQALVADGPVIFAVAGGVDVYDPKLVESASRVVAQIKALPGVHSVDSLYTGPGGQIGADDRSTLIRVELAENLSEPAEEALEDQIVAKLHTIVAPSVLVGGDHLAQRAFGEQAGRDLAVGESVAFAALLVALVVIFSGLVGAAIPLVVAIVGVCATLLALLGLSTVTEVGDYSLNIVTLLGLGLAVDYALLIVARYREELVRRPREDALVAAMAHAGRTVAVSGVAVAVALAGLSAFAQPLLASMALGGTVVALVITALALTAVPALIAVAGPRLPAAGEPTWVTRGLARLSARVPRRQPIPTQRDRRGPREREPLLVRLASYAQRHPAAVALASTVGLLVLALPALHGSFGNSDARSLPASLEERRAYDAYQLLFGHSEAAPVTVVATVDATTPQLRDYLNRLNREPGVTRLTLRPDVPAGSVIVDLTPKGTTAGPESRDLVRAVRAAPPPFPIQVTGEAAKLVDYESSVGSRLPIAVVVVVLAVMVLLYLLTRSVVVPVKAIVLTVLTFVASLGVLVVVFGWGWGQWLLRFQSWGSLDLTTPLLLFVFIFGLSLDYEVFLLARIREEYDRGGDNDRAVIAGIGRSGPVVTAAAVCITIVFLGFAAGGLVAVKEIGVGMAVAVILDVTVVRGLLLPAVMTMLGPLNWWTPFRKTSVRSAGGPKKVESAPRS